MSKSVYQGYIKDYEGATLMGCELNPKIVYTEFSAVVRRQKEILKKLIERKQAQIRKVHPGLTCFKDGVRDIQIESIPGIIEVSNSKITILSSHEDDWQISDCVPSQTLKFTKLFHVIAGRMGASTGTT